MNKLKVYLVTLLILLISSSTFAQMYKWVDDEGNISYADQPPFKGAEKLDAPELTTVPAKKIPEKKAEPVKEDKKETKYTFFRITSPENDATIRNNEGNFSVSLGIKPPLNTTQGHYFTVLVDGKAVQKKTHTTTISLNNIDRGTHKISASIKDKNNKVLRTAKSIAIHLHRQSVLRKTPR